MYGFIGDAHLGVKLPNEDYLQSLGLFLKHIKEAKEKCHAIFVVGDLFDHRLTIDDAQFAAEFIIRLVCNGCGRGSRSNVPVYFIHGTYTHDLNQYSIYMPMLRQIQNVEAYYIIHHGEFTLDNCVRVLAIPHENGDVDYTEDFGKKYDLIVGHGVIVEGNLNPCNARSGIIHSAKLLGDISKLCVFGHYHGYTDFGNGVYYTGPWLRWRYGEDEDRVFFYCDDEFKVKTYSNPIAVEYKTIEISDVEQLRELVASDIQTPHRFVVNNVSSEELNAYKGIVLTTKMNPNITYDFRSVTDTAEDVVVEDEEYASTKSEQPIPALVKYIKDKYDVDATEKLTEYASVINKDKKEES